jgi:hypothetical protein
MITAHARVLTPPPLRSSPHVRAGFVGPIRCGARRWVGMSHLPAPLKTWKRAKRARKQQEACAKRATVCIVRDGRGRVIRAR